MRFKRTIAGITALVVLGSAGCPAVFAENITDVRTETDFGYEETAAEETAVEEANVEETDIEEISPEAIGVAINETNFPDPIFRDYVLKNIDYSDGILSKEEIAAVTKIDVRFTDICSLKGIEYFTSLRSLDCSECPFTSLDLSKNTALTELVCELNQLTSLDLSNNTALTYVDVNHGHGKLTSINLGDNKALVYLNCGSNQLTSLDVSKNTALTDLSCSYNQLTSLDVSKNTALEHLDCSCNQIPSLDVSKNTALTDLSCSSNQLTSLNVRSSALTYLACSSNQLTSLNVSVATALTELWCGNNQLTSLDVSKNTALTLLQCQNNSLTSLDVSNNTALTKLWCGNNQLTRLDVSKNTNLKILSCIDNHLTSLDLSNNMLLFESDMTFEAGGDTFNIGAVKGSYSLSKLEGFDPEKASNWTGAEYDSTTKSLKNFENESGGKVTYTYDCGNDKTITFTLIYDSYTAESAVDAEINEATFPDALFRKYVSDNFDTNKDGVLSDDEIAAVENIDISASEDAPGNITDLKGIEYFVNLRWLVMGYQSVKSLDLRNNTALEGVWAENNQLTSIDVSANTALTNLYLGNNPLTSIDVSNNKKLESLWVFNNKLSEIDVTQNTALKELNCSNCQLTSIDVTKNTALENLNCQVNQISSLNVSNNPKLKILDVGGNKIKAIDLSNNTALENFYCWENELTELDLGKNTRLAYLCADNNNLMCLDLSKNTALYSADFQCRGNRRSIKIYNNEFKLSDVKGFDPSKMSDLNGAEYDSVTKSLKNFGADSGEVTYTYDCGGGKAMNVTLYYEAPSVAINDTNFPDAAFRKYVSDNFDKDKNGILSAEEAGSVTYISVSGTSENPGSIQSLKGVEYFPNITDIFCDYNKIKELDLSKNTKLKQIFITGNGLEKLDVSNNPAVKRINSWSGNSFKSLDVTSCTALEELICAWDNNGGLFTPKIGEKKSLKVIDLGGMGVKELDVSGCPALTELKCGLTPIETLDLSNNPELTVLECGGYNLKTLDLSNNPELTSFSCEYSNLASVNLSKNAKLKKINIKDCGHVKEIDLSGCTALEELYLNTDIKKLDVRKNTSLKSLSCVGNWNSTFESLIIGNNKVLKTIDVNNNKLKSINVSGCPALTELICTRNSLEALDVTKNPALEVLDCGENCISDLDLSNNKKLKKLDVSNNFIGCLDLSNTAVEEFDGMTDKDGNVGYNRRYIGDVVGSYCLVNIKGFDPSKSSNWKGAEYDPSTLSIKNFDSSKDGVIYYTYDCGRGFSCEFEMHYDSYTAAPEKLTVTAAAGDGSVTLNWSNMGTGVTYKVYSYNKSTNKYTAVAEVTGTTYTVTGLKNGTEYGYLVRAKINGAWTSYTANDIVYATPKGITVDKPVVTAAAGDGSVTLSWNDMGAGVTYKVYSYTKSNNKYSAVADVTGTTYTVKGLTNGKEYGYLVRAKINGTWSAYTANDVVYATPKGIAVDKPVVTASAGDGSVTLKWNDMGTGVTYKVYSYNKSTKKYAAVADVKGTAYTVTGLKNGTEYGYLVRAKVNGTWSAYTANDVVYATPKGSAADKLVVTASAGDGSVTLKWNDMGTGVTYKVYSYNKSTKKYASVADVTGTTYTVTGLTNGKEYGYLVRAKVNGAWTSYTVNDVVYATPKGGSTADKPVVTATAGNKQITLKWQSMGEGVTYKIYSYNKSTNKYTAVTTVSGTSYTVTGLKNGTEYGYLVRANINGKMTSYTAEDVVYATPQA